MNAHWHPRSAVYLVDPPTLATPTLVRMLLASAGGIEVVYGGDRMWPAIAHGSTVRMRPAYPCEPPEPDREPAATVRRKYDGRGGVLPSSRLERNGCDRAILLLRRSRREPEGGGFRVEGETGGHVVLSLWAPGPAERGSG